MKQAGSVVFSDFFNVEHRVISFLRIGEMVVN